MEDMYAVRTLKGVVSLDRDIASAIKDVLDAVNEVSKKHQGDPRMREYKKVKCKGARVEVLLWSSLQVLDNHKKVFVKSSRSFSDTLKRFFRDGRYCHSLPYRSACHYRLQHLF